MVWKNSNNYCEYFHDVVFMVQATHWETFCIWEKYADQQKHIDSWKDDGGYLLTVGELASQPVAINVQFVMINGLRVMFYNDSSSVVDWRAIDSWKHEYVPIIQMNQKAIMNSKKHLGNFHCDAQNFWHCISAIKLLNKQDEK